MFLIAVEDKIILRLVRVTVVGGEFGCWLSEAVGVRGAKTVRLAGVESGVAVRVLFFLHPPMTKRSTCRAFFFGSITVRCRKAGQGWDSCFLE